MEKEADDSLARLPRPVTNTHKQHEKQMVFFLHMDGLIIIVFHMAKQCAYSPVAERSAEYFAACTVISIIKF